MYKTDLHVQNIYDHNLNPCCSLMTFLVNIWAHAEIFITVSAFNTVSPGGPSEHSESVLVWPYIDIIKPFNDELMRVEISCY